MVDSLTIEEIEELGYYDFMAYLEVPFFNIGGAPSIDLLAVRCSINEDSHVLDVGCGTGGNAVYLVEHFGCRVTGIDISELMIEQAKRRIEGHDHEDQLEFHVGDAYELGFPDESFDAVLTVFVSQFLDLERAFPGFLRVLKPGGFLGINEMYMLEDIPEVDREKVDSTEEVFRDLIGLPFSIRSPEVWERGFRDAGFLEVSVESFSEFLGVRRGLGMVGEMGGWVKLLGILGRTAWLGLRSKKIRGMYGRLSRGKNVMLRDKETSKYFGYVLGVGRKPN